MSLTAVESVSLVGEELPPADDAESLRRKYVKSAAVTAWSRCSDSSQLLDIINDENKNSNNKETRRFSLHISVKALR